MDSRMKFYIIVQLLLIFLLNRQCGCQNSTIVNETAIQAPTFDVTIKVEPESCFFTSCYVATGQQLNISATIDDKTYNDNTTIFKWSNNQNTITTGPGKSAIKYAFDKDYDSNYIKVDVTHPKTNGTATSTQNLIVKSPVVVADPVGKFFLESGELLKVNLTYSGSPPFSYCYKFCSKYDILPCDVCLIHTETNEKIIPIVHYLHYVGNYTLLFDISNVMNRETKYYAIKINDTVRQSTLPIAPIVSSILAVCILVTGVGLHLRYRETSYNTEIANFDFVREYEEDWEEELSFIQRVKYLFCRGEQDDEGQSEYLLNKSSTNYTQNGNSSRSNQ